MDQWLETRTYLNAELGAPQPQSESVYPLIQGIAQAEVQSALAGLPTAEPTSLVAGNNITITGTGVPLDPYVVSSGTTVLAAGLNTTIEGNGTAITPYRVNVQLPDPSPPVVVSSGNALTTEVQQTADGYAVSAKPVQLTAGNFITIAGDGYATPYVITAVSDVTDTVLADGQNTQVEGDGTIATPYRINVTPTTVSSGDAITTIVNQNGADYSVAAVPYKLEAGPRVSLSGGDGYAAPIVVSADAVELVNGNNTVVSGDGTSVTPFRVDVNFPDAIPVISGDPQTTTVDLTPQGYSVVARRVSVVAGDNVTISGDGYDDPYTINAVGGVTAGINTLVVGTGTALDPYRVNVAPPTTLENGNAATTTITQDLTATENKYTIEAKPFLLTPGPNITITGDGYLNPYVIGASGSIQATALVSGLNTVVSGDGSSAAPYQVAAPPPVVIESTDTNTLEVVQTLIPTENKYSLTATPFKLQAGTGIQLSADDGYANPVSISVDFPPAPVVTTTATNTTEVLAIPTGYDVRAKPVQLTAGTNVSITGDGYTTPYTITASATGTATLLADGQNSTIVGDGSLATPYQVNVAPPTTIVNGDRITTSVISSLTPSSSEYTVSAVPYQLSAGPGIGLSATDGYSAPRLLTNTRPMAPGRTVFVASSWPADADPSLYFTSLTAAETSITTATFEDPWTVVVYPGTYIEPDLQFKPDVYVVGTSAQGCFIRSNAMSFESQVTASTRLVLENLTLVCNSLTYTSIAKPQQLITDFVLESCYLTPLDFEMVSLLCDLREFITQDRLTMNNCVAVANIQGQNGDYTMRDTQFIVPPAFTGVALFTLQPGNRGQPTPHERPIMRYYGGVIDRSTTATANNLVLTSVRALFKSTLITASVLTRTGASSTVPRVLFPGCQFLAMPSATRLTFDTGEISLMGASYSALWLSATTNPNSKVDRDAHLIGVSSLARNTTTLVNIRPSFSDSLYTVEYAGNRVLQGNPPAPAAGGNIIPYTMERTPTSFSYYMNSPSPDTNSFFDIIVRRYTTPYNSI